MNQNPDQPATAPPTGFFASVRRLGLWRTDDRWIGGVAAGLAHRTGLDPIVVRGLFVVTAIFGGLGLLLYGAAWALLPEASDGRIHLEEVVRGRFDVALVGAALFFFIGLSNPVLWWDGPVGWSLSWLIAVGAVVGVVALVLNQRRPSGPSAGPGPYGPDPHGAGWPTAGPVPPPSTSPPPPGSPPTAHDTPEPAMTAPGTTTPAGTGSLGSEDPTQRLDHDVTDRIDLSDTAVADTGATTALPVGYSSRTASDPVDDVAGTPATDTGATWADHSGTSPWGGSPAGGPAGAAGPGSGGWGPGGSGTGGWGPGGPAAPVPPPTPPAPVRVVPGPGSRLTSAVLAVCLLAVAGLALANHTGVLEGNVWLLAGGTALAVLGLGVTLSGALGRRQGGLGVLGFLAALVLVPGTLITATVPGLGTIGGAGWSTYGDTTFTPTTLATAESGRSLGAGTLVVDLTELDAVRDVTVPVSVGAGTVRLLVPADLGLSIEAEIGAGELTGTLGPDWSVDRDAGGITSTGNGSSISGGVGVDVALSRPGTPHVTVEAELGLGQITIEEQS